MKQRSCRPSVGPKELPSRPVPGARGSHVRRLAVHALVATALTSGCGSTGGSTPSGEQSGPPPNSGASLDASSSDVTLGSDSASSPGGDSSSAIDSDGASTPAEDSGAGPGNGRTDAATDDAGPTADSGANGVSAATACASVGPGGYYLDSAGGNDSSDGTSPATAWRTLTKVNGVTYQPGNRICFKAGGSWTGQLQPKGSGTSAAPILIGMYGSGAKPSLAAGATDTSTVTLLNQQYWEINDLEVTNTKASLGDYRGISVNGQNGGTLNHIYIQNCFVHDVTGNVVWIGGSGASAPGITFGGGWDASKKSGGIVFDVQAGSGTAVKTRFNDVLIQGNTVQDCSFGGIIFKQLDGTVHWGTRSSATDPSWTPHTNVVVRGNYLSQLNTKYGCDAIYMTDVQNGLIEENVSDGAGTSAIELYYTDSVTVQKNETFGTTMKAGGADWNGMDTDEATTNTVIQYNYFHDNGDGILICQFSFGSSVIRYNIVQNNSRYQIYLHSDPSAASSVYNNTVYNDKDNSGVTYGYGTALAASYAFQNNIFFAASGNGLLTTGGGITYHDNLYSGSSVKVPAGDSKPITANPMLMAPGTGTSGGASGPAFGSLGGYELEPGSPALHAGVTIVNNGGLDFWGTPLPATAPDLGAYEAP
jgi:hypothetical protein